MVLSEGNGALRISDPKPPALRNTDLKRIKKNHEKETVRRIKGERRWTIWCTSSAVICWPER